MPDGNGGLNAPHKEAGREGIVARASVKLEEFRQKIKALFEKTRKGEKVINQDDQARVREIFAIAEADAVRVQDEGRSLDTILGEAQAGLARSAVSEDLGRTLDGLKESRQKLIEKALAEYREALVEVLKTRETSTEGEAAPLRDPEEERLSELVGEIEIDGSSIPQSVLLDEAERAENAWKQFKHSSEADRNEKRRLYEGAVSDVKAAYKVYEAKMAHAVSAPREAPVEKGPKRPPRPRKHLEMTINGITRDFGEDDHLIAGVFELKKPTQHVAEYDKLIGLAEEAQIRKNDLRFRNDPATAEPYLKAITALEAAVAAYIVLAEAPLQTVASTSEKKTAEKNVEERGGDEAFITGVLDMANPNREDLKGPFGRMMLIATRADALSRRVKTDLGQREEYQDTLSELRDAYKAYQLLEHATPPTHQEETDRAASAEVREHDLKSAAEVKEKSLILEAIDRIGLVESLLLRTSPGQISQEQGDEFAKACDAAMESIQEVEGLDMTLLLEVGKQLRAMRSNLGPFSRIDISELSATQNTFSTLSERTQVALYKLESALTASTQEVVRSTADLPDLAELLQRNPTTKKGPQRPDPSLLSEAQGPLKVPADVAERLKKEAETRAEARAEKESKDVIRLIEALRADKKRDAMALVTLFKGSNENQAAFEALMEEDLRVHVARWLVDFMDGQYEMVRLPANEAWKEVTDAKGNVMQVMEANESDKDEYKKTAVAESTYALAAVVKAGANFGFTDEKEIRATALEPLPSEQKGGMGSFVMDAAKALGKERQRGELQVAAREISSINEKLSKHALKLVPLDESEVHMLEARSDELLATRRRLMEELTGNSFTDKKDTNAAVTVLAEQALEASDDPVVEIIDNDAKDDGYVQADVISANEPPVAPEVIPPTPEAAETAIDRAELAARTEAARGMLGSIHANIATWSRGRESVGKEYYIKDAIAHIEAVVRVDEDFLMIPSPTPEDERVYKEKRDALVKGEGLAREYNRLFSLLPGQKMIYVNELDGWIKSTQGRIKDAEKRKDQAAQKSEQQRLSELQKRKEVIDAIAPFFEVWLKMETKEAAAPVTEVSTAPKPPEATTAPIDTAPPAPPEAAPAVPPAPDAAPVPLVVPPSSPDVIPPAPPSPDKADTTPEPGFANEALFSVADRTKILAWINAQRPRVDRAKKMAADKDLQEAQKRYKPFAHNLKWLDSILEATSQLTQAATMQERMNREMVLMRLKEEILVPGAEAALSEIKAERRQLKGDAQHFEDNTPYSSQFQRSKSEIKARLKQVDEEIELMEMNVELERALMEVVIVKTTNEDPGKFKKEIADGETRLEQKDISWKEVVDAASQAQEDLRTRMETRKQNTEAEPYFGAVFQAFLKEQEATIGLNKALRRFDILDKTELQVTQALRLLDVAPNGPITSALWNELPSSAKMVLKRAGEGESSTGENIKARLYEVLRGLTNDKVEADKVLQEQLKMVDGLKEQSAYVLAQKTYKKLLTDQRSIAQEIRRLTSDVQAYDPLKVTKMADKTFYVEKLREVNGRLEIAKNQQRYIEALLKDGEALLGISGRTLWGQYQKSGRESTDQAGAFEALQNQAEVTKLIEQVLEGQEQLARFRQVEATREDEIRKTLPAATVQGGGSSFRRGTPATQNRTSGGGGEKPKSVWESFKETGLYKGAAQFVEALSFWK